MLNLNKINRKKLFWFDSGVLFCFNVLFNRIKRQRSKLKQTIKCFKEREFRNNSQVWSMKPKLRIVYV